MDIIVNKGQLGTWYGNDDIGYLIERDWMIKPIIGLFTIGETNGLDIGCGKRKSLPCAIGVDKGRGFVEAGLELTNFAKPDVLCDGANLIFKDETIDWITSSHCIEHFEDPIAVLNEWLRVLKPGGVISLIVPIAEWSGKIGEPTTDQTHKHDYSTASFKKDVVDKLDVEVIAYNEYDNHWSFNCVLRKKYKRLPKHIGSIGEITTS